MKPSISPNLPLKNDAKRPFHPLLPELLERSAARHHHLCPRQVLGVRLALSGLITLGLLEPDSTTPFNNADKRLLTIVETDGCGADGLAVATDCFVGRRTLRVEDYGKVAATLVDTRSGRAVRVVPTAVSRHLAYEYAPDEESRWHQYLLGYQRIPDTELVTVQPVILRQSLAAIISLPDKRAFCQECGEEVMNEREVVANGRILCQTCAGNSYYKLTP